MTISIISHPDCALHEMGAHHPECPARLIAIQDQFLASVFSKSPEQGQAWLDQDTSMNPYTLSAALRAAGAATLAVDLVMSGKSNSVFCNVRPPGHHAERDKAMGFCIFNNIAVAAAHALQTHQLTRIAIVDFDVHHGNGTEDIFKDVTQVLFCSSFQHPFYPHTGSEKSSEHIINVPLPAGTDSQTFRDAITKHWLPALEQFKPELVLISAGFDAHIEDDMANMNLNEQDYAWVTREIKTIADKYAKGRIVSTLEGGYALSALGRSVAAHIDALLG